MVARRLMGQILTGPRTKSHVFNILQLAEERGRGSNYHCGLFKILLHDRQSLYIVCIIALHSTHRERLCS